MYWYNHTNPWHNIPFFWCDILLENNRNVKFRKKKTSPNDRTSC